MNDLGTLAGGSLSRRRRGGSPRRGPSQDRAGPKSAVVVVDEEGCVLKGNGAAARILTGVDALPEGTDLGHLLAGYFARGPRAGGTLQLPAAGLAESRPEITVIVQQDARADAVHHDQTVRLASGRREPRVESRGLVDYVQELSSPLTSPLFLILQLCRTLRLRGESLPAEDRILALESVENEADRAISLIEVLLQLTGGAPADRTASVPLHAILSQIVEDHSRRFPDRPLDVTGDSPVYARADPGAVKVALRNLLQEATRQSAGHTALEVHLHHTGTWSTVVIVRRGEEAELGGQPHWETGRGRLSEGSLQDGQSSPAFAACRVVIERMGGKVWAGQTQRGSVYTISLPSSPEAPTSGLGDTAGEFGVAGTAGQAGT
jgi:hypothetical protein